MSLSDPVTDHSVAVYATHTEDTRLRLAPVASFFVGSAATALAFSPGAQYGNEDGVEKIEYVT